ncbi:MAG: urate hydroxylase PuuD [Sulfuriferula sp.]
MNAYWLEWLNLLGRWVHLITGIAWIGASFYFVWLDNHLRAPRDPADSFKGISGEVWSVHGGGFYHAQKYRVAPDLLPEPLHWFKWEAYSTWLSGFFMLCLVYYVGADTYLIDPSVAALTSAEAIAIGIGSLALGWLIYDGLCRSSLGRDDRLLGLAVLALSVAAAWGLTHVFSGRGAFIHYGAILGTLMVGNVFFVIIPGQRELIKAKLAGRNPDSAPGLKARQRSVHNTYFTLPVIFTMMSNHYAMVFNHSYNWMILVAISIAGAAIRVYFVSRHRGEGKLAPLLAGVSLLAGVAIAISPIATQPSVKVNAADQFAQVMQVVQNRCTSCHAEHPTQTGFVAAPKGIMLDTTTRVEMQAALIYQQVSSRAMPLGNLTAMTEQERQLIVAWHDAGALTK